MHVTAKFQVSYKEPGGDRGSVSLIPVYSDDPNHENKSFWDATPAGQIQMQINNPDAFAAFELGKEYYVDFSDGRLDLCTAEGHAIGHFGELLDQLKSCEYSCVAGPLEDNVAFQELESFIRKVDDALTLDQLIDQQVPISFGEMLEIIQDDAGVHCEMEDYSNEILAIRNGSDGSLYLGYATYKSSEGDKVEPALAVFDAQGNRKWFWAATNHDLLADWTLVRRSEAFVAADQNVTTDK